MKKILILCVLFIPIFTIYAQEDLTYQKTDLITDRPTQAVSSVTVPKNHLQVESGFLYEFFSPAVSTTYFNTTLLRYGMFKHFEFRLGMDFLKLNEENVNTGEQTLTTGLSPVSIGAKMYITEEKGWMPELSLIGQIVIPKTGKSEFTTNCLLPDLRIAALNTLNRTFSLVYNLGIGWDCEASQATGIYTIALCINTSGSAVLFIESYGFYSGKEGLDNRVDAGFTCLIKNNLQLDFSAGIGLKKTSPDSFISFGLSWRIPD